MDDTKTLIAGIIALCVSHGMSRDDAAQLAISTVIKHGVEQGVDIKVMFDEVLGAGAYDRLVSKVYHDLRVKAA